MNVTPGDIDLLRQCFERSGGNPWEPKNPRLVWVDRMILAGFLRRLDGRCGFEKFKESHLGFTEAGHMAISRPVAEFTSMRVERNEPGQADSGGRVVVTFATDTQMASITGALEGAK